MKTDDELLSPTFRSSQLHTPHHLSRITIDDPHYRTYKRLPLDRLGRHWSYGGIGSPPAWDSPAFKPIQGPPVAKHHDHVGSGLFPRSRGLPIAQFYNLTSLRRSNLRWNDELVPRPLSSARVKEKEVNQPFPAEHPLSSHTPRFAVFPTPQSSIARSIGLRRSFSDCSDTGLLVANKTRGSGFRRELVLSRYTQIPASEQLPQLQLIGHDTWDTPRSSVVHKRTRSYPGPSVMFDSEPLTREGTSLAVRPSTARGRESFERSLIQTRYQEEFTAKGAYTATADILNIDKLRGCDGDDDGEEENLEDQWEETGYQDYYIARPLEGRHSANAASLLPVRREADDKLNTAQDANTGVNFRPDTAATQNRRVSFKTKTTISTDTEPAQLMSSCNDSEHKRGRVGLTRPLSQHHHRQCAFSKTSALNQFHQLYPETSPDLRDAIQSGKRHIIHGINGYYFH